MTRLLLAVRHALLWLGLAAWCGPVWSFPFGAGPLGFARPATGTGEAVVGVYVYSPENIGQVQALKPGSVTHILYGFLRLCGPGQLAKDAGVCEGKGRFELSDGPTERQYDAAFGALKARDPAVKVLASVGGWGGSDPFFYMTPEAPDRARFVAAAERFLRAHPSFDGLDIDWEHPGGNGSANGVALGAPEDGERFATLMLELRAMLNGLAREKNRPFLLTVAVNTTRAVVSRVNYQRAAPALDLVFMMTYDHYGPWSDTVGHHTSLYSSSPTADDSLDAATRNMLGAGVPAAKLVAGVAMYSRGFAGVEKPATGAVKQGPFPAGPEGAQTYRELAQQALGTQGRGIRGHSAIFDARTQAWALWNPGQRTYIGYDDPRAVMSKGRYAQRHRLAGLFAWELSQDNGDILNAMNLSLGKKPLRHPRPASKP